MPAQGCPALRALFDEAPTPHLARPPRTHHLDFYLATDGSVLDEEGGLGAVIQTGDGTGVARVSRPNGVTDNNVAEYQALHLGLDILANRVPPDASIGLLLDHNDLAANVNAAVVAGRAPRQEPPHQITLPPGVSHHWRGIEARLAGFPTIRAAAINSRDNPAHPLANDPEQYRHLSRQRPLCVLPKAPSEPQIPPPSRANRPRAD